MSGIGRKRISKWDLKEESQLSVENVQDRSWPGRTGISFHEKETESGYEDYGMRMSPGLDEWRKQRHRHSPKNEWNRSRRSGSWSRSRSRSRSPVHGFRRESGVPGRSRNRSGSAQLCRDFSAGKCRRGNHCPFYHQGSQNYEDGWDNRQRKPGGSNYSPPHDSREYPERSGRSLDCCSEFLKGRCRRGESCRYAHHGASDVFDKVSGDDVIRERENDRRRRDVSLEWSGEPKSRRSTDVTCKFFAAGNCRNGKFCRFSHHGPARVSPDQRSRDNRLVQGRSAEDVERSQNVSKWGDTDTFPNSAKWNDDKNKVMERSQNVSKWGDTDTFPNSAKWNDDKNKVMRAPKSGFTAWPTSSGWGRHDFDNRDTQDSDKAAADDKKEGLHWTAENASAGVCASEPKGGDNWLGDMEMSPDWNYKEQPSKNSMKEEEGSVVQSLQSLIPTEPTHDPDINRGVSDRLYDTSSVMQPMAVERSALNLDLNMREGGTVALPCNDINVIGKIPTSCIDLNYNMNILPGQSFEHDIQSSNVALFSSVNAVGKSQMALPSDPSGGGNIINHPNHAASLDGTPSKKLEIGDVTLSQVNSGIVPSQNMVSSEQFNSLSVSLAHILANGQQLPQIYASLSSHNATDPPAIAKTERPTEPGSAASSQPNQVMGDGKQYDPLCDSIDAKKHNVSSGQLRISPSSDLRKCIVDREPQISSERLDHSSFTVGTNGNDNNKVRDEPGKIAEITKETNAMVAEESNKVGEQGEVQQDNGSGAKVEGDAKTGEGKKIKDIKGMRTFKFALVEFVKDILKPTWKEGQMSKDAYKNIVKKVVDKVTSTMQASSVPQTQEKIDQYLSFSKPKLNKLIQAYVEKIQKAS